MPIRCSWHTENRCYYCNNRMREPTCRSDINHSRSARLDRSVPWLIYRPTRRPFRLLCSSFCFNFFPHYSNVQSSLLHYNFDLFILFCLGRDMGYVNMCYFWRAWKIAALFSFWRCMSFVMVALCHGVENSFAKIC